MSLQRIEYIIRPDGTVEERVEGVPGPTCEQITEPFEETLGEVVERVHTAEYVLKPSPTPAFTGQEAKQSHQETEA